MELAFAFLCDYAVQERKLHAIGIGWDTIYAPSLPTVHPNMTLVAKLKGTIAESGTKDISVRIIDADGVDVMPPLERQLPFEVKPPHLSGNLQIVLMLGNLRFEQYGSYAIHLVVQDHEMTEVTFNVTEPPKTA